LSNIDKRILNKIKKSIENLLNFIFISIKVERIEFLTSKNLNFLQANLIFMQIHNPNVIQ
jgi:hypothetical protein